MGTINNNTAMNKKEEIIRKIKEEMAKKTKPYTDEWFNAVKNRFDEMTPFTCPSDCPDIPTFNDRKKYDDIVVKNLIRCGAIPKNKLVIGRTYLGKCRNSEEATWDGEKFTYIRYKFGMFYDDAVKHFEDDMYYDVFVPIEEKTE